MHAICGLLCALAEIVGFMLTSLFIYGFAYRKKHVRYELTPGS